jgi:hypothetical protein
VIKDLNNSTDDPTMPAPLIHGEYSRLGPITDNMNITTFSTVQIVQLCWLSTVTDTEFLTKIIKWVRSLIYRSALRPNRLIHLSSQI